METSEITEQDLISLIYKHMRECDLTQKGFAEAIGISESYLSDILNFKRDIPYGVYFYMGYEKHISYRRIR